MKSNHPVLNNLRRLSSDHPNENHFINTLVSPQAKLSNLTKTPYDSSNKKHPGSSLRGILSPTNLQNITESLKGASSGKIEEENSRNSLKNSERKPSAIAINHNEFDQPHHVDHHYKKKSFDSQRENAQPQSEEPHPKPTSKHMNSGSMSHFRSHNPGDLYLKDVDYVINPKFSPLNGPPKMSPVNGPPKLSPKQQNYIADGVIGNKHIRKPSMFHDLGKRQLQVQIDNNNMQPAIVSKQQQQDNKITKPTTSGHSKKPSSATAAGIHHQKLREPKGFPGGASEERIHDTKIIHSQKRNTYDNQKTEKKAHNKVLSPRLTDSTRTTHGLNTAKNMKNIYQNTHRLVSGENRDSGASQNVYSQQKHKESSSSVIKENPEYIKAKQTLRGTVKREQGMKDTKRDFNFFQRVKDLEVIHNQIRNRASESDIKIDSATSHTRPKSSKHSDSHLYKDMNSSAFSAFNNQLKRNSAAQIYNSISLFENYLQSTRSAVDQSEQHYFNKWSTHDSQNNLGNIIHEAVNFMASPSNKENVPIIEESHVNHPTETQTHHTHIDEIVHELTKNNHLTQLKNNPNAKFLLLRKQVHDKRSNRGFKSDGQNLYDFHHKPIELRETDDTQKGMSTLKHGNATTEIHTLLPDTTGTTTKPGNQAQLNDIQSRVKKVLDLHRYKEKLWENERKDLLAEIQLLRAENQELGKYSQLYEEK